MADEAEFFHGTANVFADIGIPNADEHLLKASLVRKIMLVMHQRNLTQTATAALLGVGQPEVSNMIRGCFERVSIDKLLRHLVALGQDVEIVVKPLPSGATRAPEVRIA